MDFKKNYGFIYSFSMSSYFIRLCVSESVLVNEILSKALKMQTLLLSSYNKDDSKQVRDKGAVNTD